MQNQKMQSQEISLRGALFCWISKNSVHLQNLGFDVICHQVIYDSWIQCNKKSFFIINTINIIKLVEAFGLSYEIGCAFTLQVFTNGSLQNLWHHLVNIYVISCLKQSFSFGPISSLLFSGWCGCKSSDHARELENKTWLCRMHTCICY